MKSLVGIASLVVVSLGAGCGGSVDEPTSSESSASVTFPTSLVSYPTCQSGSVLRTDSSTAGIAEMDACWKNNIEFSVPVCASGEYRVHTGRDTCSLLTSVVVH